MTKARPVPAALAALFAAACAWETRAAAAAAPEGVTLKLSATLARDTGPVDLEAWASPRFGPVGPARRDPVGWVFAQAGPSATRTDAVPQGPRGATPGPSWAAKMFPFLESGEPVGFAPARWGGSVWVEYLRQKDSRSQSQTVLGAVNLTAASYFWRPWFAQVTGTVTAIFTGSGGSPGQQVEAPTPSGLAPTVALAGGGTVTVFPASRFPFFGSINLSDSRAGDSYASGDYRTLRTTLRQNYRDPVGIGNVSAGIDHSAIWQSSRPRDTVAVLEGRYQTTRGPHHADAALTWTRARQVDAGTDYLLAYGAHAYTPSEFLYVSSFANLAETEFLLRGSSARQRIAQVNSQAVWRPEFDEGLVVTGGGRVAVNQVAGVGSAVTASTIAGNVGASYMLTERTTLNAALTATQFDSSSAGAGLVLSQTLGATHSSQRYDLGFAGYSFSASLQGSHESGGQEGRRTGAGAQFDQQLSRSFAVGKAASLNLLLTQGGGVTDDKLWGRTQTLRAGGAASLRVSVTDAADAYFSASYTGSDSSGGIKERFQLANVQASGNVRFGAYDSLGVNLTAQWTRSDRKDPRPGDIGFEIREALLDRSDSRYLSGGVAYQHSRVFGIPRLRYLLNATFNEGFYANGRLLGDVDATRENVSRLVDSRLTYEIGRLEARLGTRFATVDGRDDLQWYLRVQRHFGQY